MDPPFGKMVTVWGHKNKGEPSEKWLVDTNPHRIVDVHHFRSQIFKFPRTPSGTHVAVGQRCTTHFRAYFSGDWDVHWKITGLLTQAMFLFFWSKPFLATRAQLRRLDLYRTTHPIAAFDHHLSTILGVGFRNLKGTPSKLGGGTPSFLVSPSCLELGGNTTILGEVFLFWHIPTYCGCTKSTSHHLRNEIMIHLQIPGNYGLNHGFEVARHVLCRSTVKLVERGNSGKAIIWGSPNAFWLFSWIFGLQLFVKQWIFHWTHQKLSFSQRDFAT